MSCKSFQDREPKARIAFRSLLIDFPEFPTDVVEVFKHGVGNIRFLCHEVTPKGHLISGQESRQGRRALRRIAWEEGDGRDRIASGKPRSEEHTSELQSRFDL